MDSVTALLVLVLAVFLWLLPVIVGFARGARNLASIAVVTVLLGWTVIGWCVALAWAFADVPPPAVLPPSWPYPPGPVGHISDGGSTYRPPPPPTH